MMRKTLTDFWGDLIFACKPRFVSQRTERVPLGNKTGDLLYIDQYILKEKLISPGRKSVAIAWIDYKKQTNKWFAPVKRDNRLSKNVQDIRQSHKVLLGSHEKLKVELTIGEKTLAKF